ncbi:S9 family peptidase [Paenibacillus spongiae]|uniref:Prolyl oligopeptidase family serine peptidase n=1 Tax=Paenibacillus spongiae TaxID=2909671 RepID=A0ABY5S785_9BACL|nr:prolyl oligopeptidase family serine peptidase [Paenibacillus spongiae]UVI28183.1 prolyl oligopeptidase family serine peptidase [Paenibacillus spongiae]
MVNKVTDDTLISEQLKNDVIAANYFDYEELSLSPDDREALIVFGNYDMPYEEYVYGRRNRSTWLLNLVNGDYTEILSSDEDAHAPRWSPDGSMIAYLSCISGKAEIWVMNQDGSGKRQISNTHSPAQNPFQFTKLCWSPDGKWIAYTLMPNGDRHSLNYDYSKKKPSTDIIVHKTRKQDNKGYFDYISSLYRSELYIIDTITGENRKLIHHSDGEIDIVGWDVGGTIVVKENNELKEVFVSGSEQKLLYSGDADLVKMKGRTLYIASVLHSSVEINFLDDGKFQQLCKVETPGYEVKLHDFSFDASHVFLTAQRGLSNYMFSIETSTGELKQLTDDARVVYSYGHTAGVKCLHQENSLIFPYSGPSEPMEIWKLSETGNKEKLSHFSDKVITYPIPEVKVIKYESDGWSIESLLVLPVAYEPGNQIPTLVYLHGGPEGKIIADFKELNCAGGQSAAFFLANQGYAVFMPNFRGSSGYGLEFEKELGNQQIMRNPFKDVMTGVDYLIEQGIADPDAIGVYGFSYGGGLSTWIVSQTDRFKGAIGICGIHDFLHWDRNYGVPFHALRPNRLGEANPKDMWLKPEIYKELSSLENIGSLQTPVLLIETGNERQWDGPRWNSDAKTLFLGLEGLGIETYLVCYTKADHGSGWNQKYQRDYLNRVLVWFEHCLKGMPLPEWFAIN